MENNNTNVSAPVSYQGGAKKSSLILAIIFAITTLGFGGAFAWAMLDKDNGGDDSNDDNSADIINQPVSSIAQEQLSNPIEGSVAEVISDFNTDKEVRDLVRELRAKAYEYVYSVNSSYDDGVNVFDNEYISRTSKSYGISSHDQLRDLGVAAGSSAIDFLRSDLVGILTEKGFSKDENVIRNRPVEGDGGYGGYYRKGDLVCVFDTGSSWFNIDCANTKWFTSADKELADAVNAIKGYNKDYYIGANTNAITATKDGKYEKAEITVFPVGTTVGGYTDLYYRKVDGGEWTYITAVQGSPECGAFDADATQAYKGMLCFYQENGEWKNKKLGE